MSVDFFGYVVSQAGIGAEDSVLAVCAGTYDKTTLVNAGVRSAVISNVDHHDGISEYAPYDWSHQDAENLTLNDESVDWAIVHAGLHHCASPHRAMCEMLRVAKKGIVVIEARDSLLMRTAVAFGLTGDYELEPAAITEGRSGGYRNTHIPNYIYRWTERDVEKSIQSFLPQRKPEIQYFYHYRIPLQRMTMVQSWTKRAITHVAASMVRILELVLPRQGNEFGFVVRKGGELQPWLKESDQGIVVDMEYFRKIFAPEKYQKNFRG
jgi:ubiquinone/menaquinone biosynthesis C-methylase UbiE